MGFGNRLRGEVSPGKKFLMKGLTSGKKTIDKGK